MKNTNDRNIEPTSTPLGVQINKENVYGPLQGMVFGKNDSWLKKYRQLVCGNTTNGFLLKFELITGLFGGIPGAPGFALRKYLYKYIIKQMGNTVIYGRNISIGHPQKIHIGKNCLIGDNCELNANGENGKIVIGDNVTIGRNTLIRSKGGKIVIGENSNIGAHSILAARSADISIGKNHMMGAFVYVGTASHQYENNDIPINRQKYITKNVEIGEDVWIGVHSAILLGSRIHRGSIIGACTLVKGEIGPNQVVAGTPARKIRNRGPNHIE